MLVGHYTHSDSVSLSNCRAVQVALRLAATGTMHGSYFCVAVDGEKFDVDIPMFVLDALSDSGSKRQMH